MVGTETEKIWSAALPIVQGFKRSPTDPRRYDLLLAAMSDGAWRDTKQLREALERHGITRRHICGYLSRYFRRKAWVERRSIPGRRFIDTDSQGERPPASEFRLTQAGQEAARASIERLRLWRLLNG